MKTFFFLKKKKDFLLIPIPMFILFWTTENIPIRLIYFYSTEEGIYLCNIHAIYHRHLGYKIPLW